MWVIGVSRLFNVGSKYYTLCPYTAPRAPPLSWYRSFRFHTVAASTESVTPPGTAHTRLTDPHATGRSESSNLRKPIEAAPGGRRVGAVPPRALHTRRPRPLVCPQSPMALSHENTTTRYKSTPPSTHYTVACALLYSGYPHVRPQSYHPQTYIAYAQTPSPPRAAAAILIIPPHARSYTIVDGIIVGITIVIILSHASSSCLPCIPRLATCPNIPTRSPPPPVPCK